MRSSNTRRCAGLTALLLVAALVVPAMGAWALPPSEGLDPGYGTSGLATVGYNRTAGSEPRHLDANVSAKAPGGGVVVAGVDTKGLWQVVSIARLTNDGAADPTFSGDGKMSFDTDPETDYGGVEVCDVLVQPDGAIVVSVLGPSTPTGDAVLYRFTASGARDTTFSGDGKMRIDWGDVEPCAQIALRPDGRLVVASKFSITGSFQSSVALAQVLPDGTLDTSFSKDGKRLVSLTNRAIIAPYEIFDVAVQAGKTIVVGSALLEEKEGYRESDGLVARFTAAGARDKTFSGDGWLLRTGTTRFHDVEVSGDKLVVLAVDHPGDGLAESTVLGRLTAAGTWDTTFSGDGLARRPAPFTPVAVAVDSGGSVVVAAYDTGSTPGSLLWRYDSSGVPDGDFGGNVAVELSHCADYETPAACFKPVGVHPVANGKIVVAGGARNCPGLACPIYDEEPEYVPRRFGAVRVKADPLVAVYADPSLRDSSAPAESEDAGTARVAVRLTSKSVTPVTVSYETKPGTATAADYTHTEGTVTFDPGQVTKIVHVPLIDDGIYEGPATYAGYQNRYHGSGNERFTFRLLPASATGATVPVRDLKVSIFDDELLPEIQFPPYPSDDVDPWADVNESDGEFDLPIRLSSPMSRAFWVDVEQWLTGGQDATAGEDYIITTPRVTIAAGQVDASVTIEVLDDDAWEDPETLIILPTATSMEHPVGFSYNAGQVLIHSNDPA